MIFGFLTLITALAISAVAIYYSVAGLVAIFAAAALPILIMGTTLEIAKLVTAVWLHKYWDRATWWLKTYLSISVVVLMFITSMGIFGFLSKAHIEQTSAGEESVAQVQQIENEVTRLNAIIKRADDKVKALETSGTGSDANIQSQIDKEQIRIDDAYTRIQPAIDEQNAIIANVTSLFQTELDKIDKELQILQGYVDNNEIKKAQQMIGASADGVFGKKTAEKIGDWKDAKQAERAEWLNKIQQSANSPTVKAARTEIQRLRINADKQIAESNKLIDRLRSQLGNTDRADDIDGQVDDQNLRIRNANAELDSLTEEKYALEGEYRKLEAEVGPIKYIAEFVYGESADKNMLEEAVKWVIIVIIFVFDPLAVLMLIASQYTFNWHREQQYPGGMLPPKSDPDPTPNDPKETKKEPTFEDIDQETLDKEFDHEFVGLEDEPTPKYKFDDEFGDYETVRAELIRNNRPEAAKSAHSNQLLLWPEVDPIPDDTGRVAPTEQDYEVDPNQMELDFSNNDQLKEDLDKWNDWVDTATKAAEEEDAKENDIITGIGSAKGTFSEAQKKTSYITKVENKQVRKKTDV